MPACSAAASKIREMAMRTMMPLFQGRMKGKGYPNKGAASRQSPAARKTRYTLPVTQGRTQDGAGGARPLSFVETALVRNVVDSADAGADGRAFRGPVLRRAYARADGCAGERAAGSERRYQRCHDQGSQSAFHKNSFRIKAAVVCR